MENIQDFVIRNSVLTKYTGPSGDVVVPEGVTEIGRSAFQGCENLTIHAPTGSTAEQYTVENGIRFDTKNCLNVFIFCAGFPCFPALRAGKQIKVFN